MNSKVLQALDSIRQELVDQREEGAPVSPMQGLLDECVCQEAPADEDAEPEEKKPLLPRWKRS